MPTSTNIPTRAARYVRMSTENQEYSIANQSDTITQYARQHDMEIVKTYNDAAKSGLTVRPALRQLIADVEGGSADYSAILVYDVSRWGRFQDADESAYYEYRCRRANIAVHYCAEPFMNDGTPYSALVKTIKRMMAAEYSRELSVKVFAGQSRLTEMGFRQGGTAGLGLRRMLVAPSGKPKFLLARGQEKSIATDRVVLVPGPAEEIAALHEVFRLYVEERMSTTGIANLLNERGILGEGGRKWTRYIVRRMVTNPKYIGANVTNRQSAKLRGKVVQNPPEMWIRRENAFPALVDPEIFRKAQIESASRSTILTDKQLLDLLHGFLKRRGKISERLLRDSPDMPCGQVFAARFGGLAEAYRRIGYTPRRDLSYVKRDQPLAPIRAEFIEQVLSTLMALGASVRQDTRRHCLTINNELNVRLSIVRCCASKRTNSWKLQFVSPFPADVTVFARTAPSNDAILDYLCIPQRLQMPRLITVSSLTPPPPDAQQFSDLAFLEDFAKWGRRTRRR
jgi:DNA invertase Pin-like site-specific DNA recombinase